MSIGSFLQSVGGGILDPHGNLGDYQHASRLFVNNQFALAPKNSWIFYVSFDISQEAIQGSAGGAIGPGQGSGILGLIKEAIKLPDDWQGRHQQELGMLVKAADLPKFTIEQEYVNQYNKKTLVQKKINYNPLNISFHDDMSNVTHRLWVYYYNYYYADGQNPLANGIQTSNIGSSIGKALGGGLGSIIGGAIGKAVGNKTSGYTDNKYQDTFLHPSGNYGLNNGQTVPFFNSITIYQLNQQQFTSFTLVNPIITEWTHDKLDVSTTNKVQENKMTIAYETVLYGTGQVSIDNPPGFATIHYDQSPSPLSVLGSIGNALNKTGADNVFGAITGLQGIGNPLSAGGLGLTAAGLLTNKSVISAATIGFAGIKSLFNKSDGKAGVNPKGIDIPAQKDSSTTASETGVQPTPILDENAGDNTPYDVTALSLPDPLPEDVSSLETLRDEQNVLQGNYSDQLGSMQRLQAEYQPQLDAAIQAGDQTKLDSLHQQMESDGYIDPALVQMNLDKIAGNIDTVASALTTAYAANDKPENTGEENNNNDTQVASDNVEGINEGPTNTDNQLSVNNTDEQQDEWWA